MKIRLSFLQHEAAAQPGLFDKLSLIAEALTRRGAQFTLDMASDRSRKTPDTVTVALGGALSRIRDVALEYGETASETAAFVLSAVSALYFENGRCIIARLFGRAPDFEGVLSDAENACKGKMLAVWYRESDITSVVLMFGEHPAQASAVADIFAAFEKNIIEGASETLQQRLVELLTLKKKKISVAESLTGGGVIRRIVSVPGASNVLYEGIVAYTEESKVARLGVQPATLRQYGAVSDQAAYEMAAGLLTGGTCDFAVATTGLAGPGGAQPDKPVGLTFIAVGTVEGIHVYKHIFTGTRENIMQTAADTALFYAIRRIKTGMDYETVTIK